MAIDCSTFVKNLLAVIAKTITLQIKDKVAHKMQTVKITESFSSLRNIPCFWLKKTTKP
jgi:hypothetical protein